MKFQILFCANIDTSTCRINEHFGGEGLEEGAALENSKQLEGSVRSTLSGLFAELKQLEVISALEKVGKHQNTSDSAAPFLSSES